MSRNIATGWAILRDMVQTLPHPVSGAAMRFLGNPFKYDGAEPLSYPPKLGAHTAEILTALCGYDAATLKNLHAQGAITLN